VNPRYTIQLRAVHEHHDLTWLSKAIGVSPSREWSTGEQRTSPIGRSLGGVRKENYWSYIFDTNSNDTVKIICNILEKLENFPKELEISKGAIMIIVDIYDGSRFAAEIDSEILGRLSFAGITLGIESFA